MSALTIQVPDSLRRHIERLTAEDGISVDQFFATAAAEKIAASEAEHYLAKRAARADEGAYRRVMAKVPPGEPEEEWDRLPPGWKS